MTLLKSCVLPGCPARTEVESDAYACPDCRLRLVRKLADIEDYLAIVSPVPGRGEPGPRSTGYESRPPLRLDVVAMFDPRTEINGPGEDDVLDEVPNVAADLDGWVRLVAEERFSRATDPGYAEQLAAESWLLGNEANFLRSHIGWISTRPWVDEFAADITRVHGVLRAACGDAPGKPFGKCLDDDCGGDVFRRSDDPQDIRLRCERCRATYSGLDLVRIRSAS